MVRFVLMTEQKLNNLYEKLPINFNINSHKQIKKLLNINKSDYNTLLNMAASNNINASLALTIIKIKKALIIKG